MDPVALLVEDEGAVFHAAGGEEADVAAAGELLRRPPRRVVGRRHATHRAHDVEVVGDERFVADEQEEHALFQHGDLGNFRVRYHLRVRRSAAGRS